MLLASSCCYGDSPSAVVTYSKEHVSWPSAGERPVPLDAGLSRADKDWYVCWRRHMLVSPEVARARGIQTGVSQIYCDPVLARSSSVYADFLCRLTDRGMVKWHRAEEGMEANIGIFLCP